MTIELKFKGSSDPLPRIGDVFRIIDVDGNATGEAFLVLGMTMDNCAGVFFRESPFSFLAVTSDDRMPNDWLGIKCLSEHQFIGRVTKFVIEEV